MATNASAAAKEMLPIEEMASAELGQLNRLLRSSPTDSGANEQRPKLVGANDEEMVLPEAIYQLLCEVVPLLKRGDPLFIVPAHKAMTTQEAADLLGMSRPYLTKLVDAGAIPSFRVGSHRRILFKDIVDYQRRREAERQASMDEILAQSDDMDVYR